MSLLSKPHAQREESDQNRSEPQSANHAVTSRATPIREVTISAPKAIPSAAAPQMKISA
jgi:hypothetical protein